MFEGGEHKFYGSKQQNQRREKTFVRQAGGQETKAGRKEIIKWVVIG